MSRAVVIGAGPAGLMAAEELAKAGHSVLICDAKPSFGRKFLMAGKSGLNLTKDEDLNTMIPCYFRGSEALRPMLEQMDAKAVQEWAIGLGQDLFTGSTGRVFPNAMKASPLLRAWLARLDALGVERRTKWRWLGWQGQDLQFDTPDGPMIEPADTVVLALGGASWARLGSDGTWANILTAKSVPITPFQASNSGVGVAWSDHMVPHFGSPLKGVRLTAGKTTTRGEAVISAKGLEGGGIYTISQAIRDGANASIDLTPNWAIEDVAKRLSTARGKTSWTNHFRKVLRLDPVRLALLQEFGRPLPSAPKDLAALVKALPLKHQGLRPIDEAISTVGGVPFEALDDNLMLRDLPGVYCAGEMLDWDAPTGGYLITACLATGRWAGRAAAQAI